MGDFFYLFEQKCTVLAHNLKMLFMYVKVSRQLHELTVHESETGFVNLS